MGGSGATLELCTEEHLRSEMRVNSRVPIVVECLEGEDRNPVEAQTLDVSPKGCLVVLPGRFAVGQSFRITNRINERSVLALLCWRGRQTSAGSEYGMELLNPAEEFWGLDF